ncbi:hypothetical protein [Streptomyces spirodelae]|uniref:Uncharacterized protein n=1 Tax=Streptomyces spirodelae TaxID=2812904 RepID=A0ABS3WVW7_9ACTN|nr:hypothetical protein [Streptomyces spirodelae]MBO8187285.1 hypothetical protein [Streptomyces spirodelae]
MCGPGDGRFDGEAASLDEELWVRGVDYVGGWRDAKDTGEELLHALSAAGLDTDDLRARADATADGSGVVQLAVPVEAARELAMLVRVASARLREAG